MNRKTLCCFAVFLLGFQAAGQNKNPVFQDPTASQNIVQPPSTNFSTNNEAGIYYVVSSYNWLQQSPNPALMGGMQAIVTLSPGPAGILVLTSTTAPVTRIYITDNNNSALSEAVAITATTCPLQGNGPSGMGTITFTPANSHTAKQYKLGSASQGIQEALNAATLFTLNPDVSQPSKVVIPPASYTALARISIVGSRQYIDANGAVLTCTMADSCLFVGDPTNVTFPR